MFSSAIEPQKEIIYTSIAVYKYYFINVVQTKSKWFKGILIISDYKVFYMRSI